MDAWPKQGWRLLLRLTVLRWAGKYFKTYFSLNLNVSDARRFLNVVFASKTSGAEFYESRLCLILRKASFESRLLIFIFELRCEQNFNILI
jgi:hypothetical protein